MSFQISSALLNDINKTQSFIDNETDNFNRDKAAIALAVAARYLNKEGMNKKEAVKLLRAYMSNGACSEQYVK